MGAKFIYQSKTEDEMIKNTARAWEVIINQELKNFNSDYFVMFKSKEEIKVI
jgi:hypothetical protein